MLVISSVFIDKHAPHLGFVLMFRQVLSLDTLRVLPFQSTEASDFGSMDVWLRFTNPSLQERYTFAHAADALPTVSRRLALLCVGRFLVAYAASSATGSMSLLDQRSSVCASLRFVQCLR
jgi:hypothetical protein